MPNRKQRNGWKWIGMGVWGHVDTDNPRTSFCNIFRGSAMPQCIILMSLLASRMWFGDHISAANSPSDNIYSTYISGLCTIQFHNLRPFFNLFFLTSLRLRNFEGPMTFTALHSAAPQQLQGRSPAARRKSRSLVANLWPRASAWSSTVSPGFYAAGSWRVSCGWKLSWKRWDGTTSIMCIYIYICMYKHVYIYIHIYIYL